MTLESTPSYDFLAPRRIVFGWGRWPEAGPSCAEVGRRALVVLGSKTLERSGLAAELATRLARHGVACERLAEISNEPTVAAVDEVAARIRGLGVRSGDFVLALGGGSAIDLAKAAAALATNTEAPSVRDYLEGVGRGLALAALPLPVVALPTTAGTGSEATRNAVISVDQPAVKKSLRHDALLPRLVIVDPQLAVSLPADVTAHTGMDAITQLIESYISKRARPIPRALAIAALPPALEAIVAAVEDPNSRPAREAMAQAALVSGMALANAGLGLAHGVAAALGVHCRLRHGLACALMLPAALEANRSTSTRALAELARAAGLAREGADSAAADALAARIDEISRRIGIPARLSQAGVRADQLPALVRDARGNSMDGNPRTLSDDELGALLSSRL